MLDYRIYTFLEVCRYMNFTKAAKSLDITQPAVSQHIRWLEDQYQAAFFKYQGKKMVLTEEGEVFLNAARTFRHDDLYLRQRIQEMKNRTSKITFGATLTIGDFVLPQSIGNFIKRNPEVELSFAIGNTAELLKKINDGMLDFALVEGYFEKEQYDYRVFSREPFIAVCSPDYHFVKEPKEIKDLLEEPLLIRETGSGTREILEKNLESKNLGITDFKKYSEINSLHAIKSLTEGGCGITFLYRAAVKNELRTGTLKEMKLEDFKVIHDFDFVWRKNSIFSKDYFKIFEKLRQAEQDS